jgi:hypothetical protein
MRRASPMPIDFAAATSSDFASGTAGFRGAVHGRHEVVDAALMPREAEQLGGVFE